MLDGGYRAGVSLRPSRDRHVDQKGADELNTITFRKASQLEAGFNSHGTCTRPLRSLSYNRGTLSQLW